MSHMQIQRGVFSSKKSINGKGPRQEEAWHVRASERYHCRSRVGELCREALPINQHSRKVSAQETRNITLQLGSLQICIISLYEKTKKAF